MLQFNNLAIILNLTICPSNDAEERARFSFNANCISIVNTRCVLTAILLKKIITFYVTASRIWNF